MSTPIRTVPRDEDRAAARLGGRAGATTQRRMTTMPAKLARATPTYSRAGSMSTSGGQGTSRIALFTVVPTARMTTVTRSSRVSRWPVG